MLLVQGGRNVDEVGRADNAEAEGDIYVVQHTAMYLGSESYQTNVRWSDDVARWALPISGDVSGISVVSDQTSVNAGAVYISWSWWQPAGVQPQRGLRCMLLSQYLQNCKEHMRDAVWSLLRRLVFDISATLSTGQFVSSTR